MITMTFYFYSIILKVLSFTFMTIVHFYLNVIHGARHAYIPVSCLACVYLAILAAFLKEELFFILYVAFRT